MKIYERNSRVRITMLFLFMTVFFHYIQISLWQRTTALSKAQFYFYLEHHIPTILILLSTIISMYFMVKISRYFFVIHTVNLTFQSLIFFSEGMNKIILVMCFLYLFFSYYYYQIWSQELKTAAYNPNYSNLDYDLRAIGKLEVEVIGENKIRGLITNWDEDSIFIKLDGKMRVRNRNVKVNIFFEGMIFNCHGKIISSYSGEDGIGVNLYDKGNKGWQSLHRALEAFGLLPSMLVSC